MLMQLIAKLEKAVADAGTNAAPDLVTLLASARRNRTVLLEEAPVLVAEALASSPEYARQRAGAVAAVDAAAERLNAMRARSDDEATPYAELAPLVGQLKELWAGLDRALAPLSRGEQDAIRGERAEPMTTAAKALTRNLFLRKMRDRGRGDWPAPEVLPGETAPERFASALAGGDYGQASTLLAPWLEEEWTAARLEEEMSRSVAEIVAGFDLPVGPPAGAWEVGSNPLDLAALKEDESEAIPEDVSEANFRGWWPVQILTEEEDGWLTDIGYLATLFVIAVELDGQERIGYLRFGE
jgi:hypothetical protein